MQKKKKSKNSTGVSRWCPGTNAAIAPLLLIWEISRPTTHRHYWSFSSGRRPFIISALFTNVLSFITNLPIAAGSLIWSVLCLANPKELQISSTSQNSTHAPHPHMLLEVLSLRNSPTPRLFHSQEKQQHLQLQNNQKNPWPLGMQTSWSNISENRGKSFHSVDVSVPSCTVTWPAAS